MMRYLRGVSTLEFDPEKCTGCMRCVEVCPHRVFKADGKRAALTDKDLCMECGACERNCAYGVIRVGAGVGCAAALINGMITGSKPVCGCSTDDSGCC